MQKLYHLELLQSSEVGSKQGNIATCTLFWRGGGVGEWRGGWEPPGWQDLSSLFRDQIHAFGSEGVES